MRKRFLNPWSLATAAMVVAVAALLVALFYRPTYSLNSGRVVTVATVNGPGMGVCLKGGGCYEAWEQGGTKIMPGHRYRATKVRVVLSKTSFTFALVLLPVH